MKTITPFLALAAVLCLAGCASTPEGKQDEAQRIGRVLESLAFTGATLYLEGHPEHRVAFAQAASSLAAISAKPEIDILDIRAALAPLPIRELKTPEATLIVGNVQIILDEFDRGKLDLDRLAYLRPAAQGLSRGITRALGGDPPPEPPQPVLPPQTRAPASSAAPGVVAGGSVISSEAGFVEVRADHAPAAASVDLSRDLAEWTPALVIHRPDPGPLVVRDYDIHDPKKFYRVSPR